MIVVGTAVLFAFLVVMAFLLSEHLDRDMRDHLT